MTAACRHGKYDVVCLLLEQPNIDVTLVDEKGCLALQRACICNYPDIVEKLIQREDVDVNQLEGCSGQTALLSACLLGHNDGAFFITLATN